MNRTLETFRPTLVGLLDQAAWALRIVPYWIRGAQGAQHVQRVEGLPLRLGELTSENQAVPVFPMAKINEAGGRYAAGLLGNLVLWRYRVHMDFRRGRLILERYRDRSEMKER